MSPLSLPGRNATTVGHAAMVLQTLLVGMGYSLARLAAVAIPPLALMSMRLVLAALLMLPLFFLRGGFARFRPDRRDWRRIVLLALVGVMCNQFLFMFGLRYTTAANSALIYALTPSIVLLMAVYVLRSERLSRVKVLGAAVALAGVVLIFLEHGLRFANDMLLGNLLTVVALFCWSAYLAFNRGLAARYDSLQLTAAFLVVGGVASVPIGLAVLPRFDFAAVPASAWWGLAYLVLVLSLVAFLLITIALTRLPSSQVALYTNLQPVVATLFGVLVFGEPFTWLFAIGGTMTVGGILVLNLSQRRTVRQQRAPHTAAPAAAPTPEPADVPLP